MASVNDIVGNYRLVKELASGAFGRVYRGEHTILTNRIAAIKLLHSTHLNSQQERDSFIREAKLLEQLRHPHILPIIDVGLHDGFPYLVTEYAPNGSLRDRLQRQPAQPLPMQEILTILSQVGQALQHAHQQNIIHRDLKPENILFNTKGEVLLADFGIATVYSTLSLQQATIIGTPAYMAPEQFRGLLCKESDQYALGCITYELFTGLKPFTALDFIAMGFKHMTEQPVAPRQLNPALPVQTEQAILKAMAKERIERYADVAAFIKALRTPPKTKEQWLDEGKAHYHDKRYYEQVIQLDPNETIFHNNKSNTLRLLEESKAFEQVYEKNPTTWLQRIAKWFQEPANAKVRWLRKGYAYHGAKRYQEALAAYEHAIQLDPNDAIAYYGKGVALSDLKRYQDALAAYDRAIQLNPNYAYAYNNKGIALRNLNRYDEALASYDRAIQLNPNYAYAYYNKGIALLNLKRYDEALAAFDRAIRLDPNDADYYHNKTLVLERLGRSEEAQNAHQRAKQLGYSE